MLMIMAVVNLLAAAMQVSGGLDHMIEIATRVAPQSEIHHLYRAGGNFQPLPSWQVQAMWLYRSCL